MHEPQREKLNGVAAALSSLKAQSPKLRSRYLSLQMCFFQVAQELA